MQINPFLAKHKVKGAVNLLFWDEINPLRSRQEIAHLIDLKVFKGAVNLLFWDEINPLRSRSEIAHLSDLRSSKGHSTCCSGLKLTPCVLGRI